jgi:hypothetical protein
MISNYVFHHLSLDSVDSTASSVLGAVNIRNKTALTEGQLPLFTYTSLKSLLGETDNSVNESGIPNWAINRIKTVPNNQKFKYIEVPGNLPLVFINTRDPKEHPKRNRGYHETAVVEIAVFTNPQEAPGYKAHNIMRRIIGLFSSYTETSGFETLKDIAEGVTAIQGITNLTLELKAYPEANWDSHRCIFLADAKVIR